MKPLFSFLIPIVLLCFILASCKKTNEATDVKKPSIGTTGTDVYVCGSLKNSKTQKFAAVYWKNGTPILLTDGSTDASATAITLYGNDVYVAGYYNVDNLQNGQRQPAYWKNGVLINLMGSYQNNSDIWNLQVTTNSIIVNAQGVYVGGTALKQTSNAAGSTDAVYWLNGTMFKFDNAYSAGMCSGLAADGSNIFGAGNASSMLDSYRVDTAATGLVYWMAGSTHPVKKLHIVYYPWILKPIPKNKDGQIDWSKDGIPTEYEDGASIVGEAGFDTFLAYTQQYGTGIAFGANHDVLVAGYQLDPNQYPIFWNNGAGHLLPTPDSTTQGKSNAIAVNINSATTANPTGDVYIAGYILYPTYPTACYWKNGIFNKLTAAANTTSSETTSIAFKINDVYISGYQTNDANTSKGYLYGNPVYWKNGEAVVLDNSNDGIATGIVVN